MIREARVIKVGAMVRVMHSTLSNWFHSNFAYTEWRKLCLGLCIVHLVIGLIVILLTLNAENYG